MKITPTDLKYSKKQRSLEIVIINIDPSIRRIFASNGPKFLVLYTNAYGINNYVTF